MKKNLLALLLAGCMVFGLAACGSADDTTTNDTQNTTGNDTTAGNDTEDTGDPASSVADGVLTG